MKFSNVNQRLHLTVALCAMAVFATGCPLLSQLGGGKADVVILLANGAEKMGPVANDDIESFVVTVTEISLDGPSDDAKGDDSEDDSDDTNRTVVFEGELEVDLKNLENVSEVLSTAEIPAGKYTKIRMCVENPVLTLVGASEPETNVRFTANGKVFVSEQFTLQGGSQQLIILSFNGIHLVEQGNGAFILTPQLRADIETTSAEAMAEGQVTALETEFDSFTLDFGMDGSIDVVYTGNTLIFLPTDTDTPTGTESDLANGQTVEVTGTLLVNGSLDPAVIRIIS